MKRFFLTSLFLGFTLTSAFAGAAETEAETKTETEAEAPKCREVRLAGEPIFCLYQGFGSIAVKERAAAVEQRIARIAADASIPLEQIRVEEANGFHQIMGGEDPIIAISAADGDPDWSLEGGAYARRLEEKIRAAVGAYREGRTAQNLLRGVVYAIGVTILFYVLWLLGRSVFDRLSVRIPELTSKYLQHVRIKSYQLVNPERITAVLLGLVSATRTLAILMLVYFYASIVMRFFPWTAPLAPLILNYVLDPLIHVLTVMVHYIPNIFYIVVILMITRYLLKIVGIFFNEIAAGNITFNGFHREWAHPTFKLVRILAYALALVMIFPYLPGSSSPAFQGVSVFLGVVISFSSGSAIANIIAGVVITYMRPFQVGDRVKIADTVGDVVERNFLITRVRTPTNTNITIPNTMVLGSHIINYSSSASEPGLILTTTVTIGFDVPWVRVHQLLKEAARRTDRLDRGKDPFVLQTALNDASVSYELNVYTQRPNEMRGIYSDLHRHIVEVFHEGGIDMLAPSHHVIHQEKEGS